MAQSNKANSGVVHGQQLHTSTQDYIKEAMQAQEQKKMDDMKMEKPLADAMVAQGYLRDKKRMADRAVDHTQIVVSSMKEVRQFTGAAHEVSLLLFASDCPVSTPDSCFLRFGRY